jgi:hypothetical protein
MWQEMKMLLGGTLLRISGGGWGAGKREAQLCDGRHAVEGECGSVFREGRWEAGFEGETSYGELRLTIALSSPFDFWYPPTTSRSFLTDRSIYNSSSVTQVNIPAATGDMGILANHVPTVEALRPGLLEIIETSGTKKYFGA